VADSGRTPVTNRPGERFLGQLPFAGPFPDGIQRVAFTEVDEKLLVHAYQAGDERAFDTIVRTQYNALYAHALRRLSQHEAAEDAVQDTLLRAYRALPNLDGDLALRAWLHRILTNVCHDEGNRRRRQHGLEEKVAALPVETAEDPVDEAVLHDTVRVMTEALKDLPESYREALVLRYVDGLSFRDVAEVTGTTEENARARVHRGRVALHKIMARLAIMAAFIIPGLKRTHDATTPAGDVALTTQLTTHAVNAAPTVSRLAEVATSMPPGAKSALAAAAVTAVAAVSVPVAVHTVQDSGSKKPAAAAVAAPQTPRGSTAVTTPGSTSTSAPVASTSTSTSQPANPFAPVAVTGTDTSTTTVPESVTTTTTTPAPTTTTTLPPATGPVGRLVGDGLTAAEGAPNWDLSGPITLTVNGKATTGTLAGRLYVYDDDTAEADELTITLGAKAMVLRFRGTVTDRTTSGSATSYRITGTYALSGAREHGLWPNGDVATDFKVGSGSASLAFDLRGRGAS
jgi:RNA polymerase sigma-70 factor (ECF subfamily)